MTDQELPEPQTTDTAAPAPSAPITPEAPPSLRDSIKSALEEAKTKDETPEQKAERVRDEQGRFTAAKTGEKREILTLKKTPDKAEAVTAAAPTAVKAPDAWKEPVKAKFAALDPEVQAEISRREAEMHRKFTSQDEERTLGKKIREIAQPYEAILRAEGASVEDSFRSLMNMAYQMRIGSAETKRQILISTARAYNVDLGVPLQQGTSDPTIAALQREIAELKHGQQAQIQERQQQQGAALKAELDAFLAEPGREHFETVKPVMAALLNSGKASTYQDAYEKAIWADPEIRSTLQAQQLREAEEKRAAEAKAKADAAKRAAGSVTGSPGGVRPSNGAGNGSATLRDEIRANLRAATGRV